METGEETVVLMQVSCSEELTEVTEVSQWDTDGVPGWA